MTILPFMPDSYILSVVTTSKNIPKPEFGNEGKKPEFGNEDKIALFSDIPSLSKFNPVVNIFKCRFLSGH